MYGVVGVAESADRRVSCRLCRTRLFFFFAGGVFNLDAEFPGLALGVIGDHVLRRRGHVKMNSLYILYIFSTTIQNKIKEIKIDLNIMYIMLYKTTGVAIKWMLLS
jgi:hypothetical protein